jgi:hypothetical protein
MNSTKTTQIMITIPTYVRDRLRAMAAQRNLQNLEQVTSAAEIARDVLLEALERLSAIDNVTANSNAEQKKGEQVHA